jgi:uncharacterized protein
MGKKIFKWIKIILVVYCLIGIALYYLQDYILFQPVFLARNKKYNFNSLYREINIPYDNETNLNIIQFATNATMVKGVVLYFHGNKKNIGWYAKYAPNFTLKGYEVWMIDYPGYGKSTGKFTERRLYDYALQLYRLARTRYQPGNIIIYGKSLGTGIATQLAAVRDCKRLILETPYYSIQSLVKHYLPMYPVANMLHYHLPTYDYLPLVTAPVTIFHGTNDQVIPYSNAERLQPLMKLDDEFVTVQKGSHNDLNNFSIFHSKLDSVLSL